MIEAQGGKVGVSSTVDKGSTFYAVLPRGVAAPETTPAVVAAPKRELAGAPTVGHDASQPSSILVIEDDERDRAWLTNTLTGAGYNVHAVATGIEAIALCRQRRFDAITLDLLLPDRHGWDVLRTIRSEALNSEVPIIVVTLVADRSAAAGFAIQDFLSKPTTSEELLRALQQAGVEPNSPHPVLVVDDDQTALKLIQTALGKLGYESCCFADSQQGLRAATELKPAAIVLDLLMPGMDGFEFLDRFRRTSAARNVPVIVWTNKDLTLEEQERLRVSAQSVVLKSKGGAAPLLEALQGLLPTPESSKEPVHAG
jgi:CheY-like chemotaxis protein